MTAQRDLHFDALSKQRAESAKALDGFALRGVKNSVIGKYSDQAHFIYELLQNADDAGATAVRFELHPDRLVFAHNGTRRFTISDPSSEELDHRNGRLGDINAITAVGGSNKTDEATIGKFGLGFKAVFQYTSSPHIYDPQIFFRIERFIVPVRLETDYLGRQDQETLFVFPFDHDEMPAADAYEDISHKLRSLDYPILFMPNLRDISFELSGTVGLYGKRIEERFDFDQATVEYVRLTQNSERNRAELHDERIWLFSQNGENGLKYSVGFPTGPDGHLIAGQHTAFCYFPTKERTGLNFFVHAPFLLTDSREGIRAGVHHNMRMIERLADLAAASLGHLKEIGHLKSVRLVDESIFDIIPYDESDFGDVNNRNRISFKPVYTSIKNAFRAKPLLPGSTGYVSAQNAYWAAIPQLASLFSTKQLSQLTGNGNAQWLALPFGRHDTFRTNKVLTEYIESLAAAWLDEHRLINGLAANGRAVCEGITAKFIERQSIEWLGAFHQWISETANRTRMAKTKPVLLNQDRKAVAPFDANGQAVLFLPTAGSIGYDTVLSELLESESSASFVEHLGLTAPSLKDEIYNIILPQYHAGAAVTNSASHFKRFLQYYCTCSQTDARSFVHLMRDHKFVLYRSGHSGKIYRGLAGSLYFPTENLKRWFQSKPDTRFVAFDEYLKHVGEDKKEPLERFLADLGVRDQPETRTHRLDRTEAYSLKNSWSRSTRAQSWEETRIDGLKEVLDLIVKEQDVDLSAFVWAQLIAHIEARNLQKGLHGYYKYFFRKDLQQTYLSSQTESLRNLPWMVDSGGEFRPPTALSDWQLPSIYERSTQVSAELMRFLGIGDTVPDTNSDNLTAEQRSILERHRRMEKAGITDDDIESLIRDKEARRLQAAQEAQGPVSSSVTHADELPTETAASRVAMDIVARTAARPVRSIPSATDPQTAIDTPDEDDYTKPALDFTKRIEEAKDRSAREIDRIARLQELTEKSQATERYSHGWFKQLLELESVDTGHSEANSREVSISFTKVEREEGTLRTLVLRHPNRHIPQSMEDLADIPLELYFADQPMTKVAVEVVSVKSYTLRAKLRTNAQIDGVDLASVVEARIVAKNPVFLVEELRKSFIKLGEDNSYAENYNMQQNLCANIEFVYGPPGTGKTTHLVREVILPLMRKAEDLKVLVLTPTNKAADVLTRRLMDEAGSQSEYMDWLVRFGATSDKAVEQSGVFRDKVFDIRDCPRNVTVTTIARFPYDYFLPDGTTRLHLQALYWDYIIIDEASMIPLANIIYPLFKKTPRQFIVAGDPLQIQPITAVDLWKNENIYTMVGLRSFTDPATVPHPYKVTLLTTQYRSIPEIGELFSHFAYGGVLKHARCISSQRRFEIGDLLNLRSLSIVKFPVSKYESIYRPKRLQSRSNYQIYSALFAFEFINYLGSVLDLARGDEPVSIGLITPYRAQADLINKLMASATPPVGIDVQVGTIHGFQGDECDIIIALFNPPQNISSSREMFLNKQNIINVSISRARDYLFILMPDDNTENINNLSLIKQVENLVKRQSDWVENQSNALEEIMFGSATYIEDNAFSTSHQIVNVYGKPEMRYEVRSEDSAVDIQVHEK